MLKYYKGVMLSILEIIVRPQDGYCDRLLEYSKTEMMKEMQNKKQYLGEEHTEAAAGVVIARNYILRLKDICEELIQNYRANPNVINTW